MFETKIVQYEGDYHMAISMFVQVEARRRFEGQLKNFKWKPLFFLLHILVSYLESFPKHYN